MAFQASSSNDSITMYSPRIGMEFESEEAAFVFYNEYGRITGFSTRRDYHTKSKKDGIMINRKFVCCKEGEREKDKRDWKTKEQRAETRTNCKASMYISFDRKCEKWFVKRFEDKHNHDLHIPQCSHMMPSQRNLFEAQGTNIDLAANTGISLKASHDLISAQAGGKENVGFTRVDQKNYLRAKRQRDLEYGEAGSLLRYFQNQAAKNPTFYYAVQLDAEEMITNIFWADHQMIIDYENFGDVVSFDTTFRTNKEYRPFACFVGFNHFRKTVIFGAALLYDETTTTFEWLFETFLHAMSGKKPSTIFTDQDQAMAKAISHVMPEVSHGLCTFHLMQNALKHLGHLFKGCSKFSSGLKACIYGYEEEDELIDAWNTLTDEYSLQENTWMKKTWEIREKWAHVYMKWVYTAGIRSTQLSESLNGALRNYLKSDHNIVQFFTHFNRVVVDKRYQEFESIYQSRQKLAKMKLKKSPILIQAAKVYTPPIFDLFHEEFDTSLGCQVKQCNEVSGELQFVICLYGERREYIVVGNVEEQKVYCPCRKFEYFGILCSHALKVLDRMNIMEIPEKYILSRWKLDARDCVFTGSKVRGDEEDPKLVISTRYRHLCPKLVKLAALASQHERAYNLVDDNINDLCAKVNKMVISQDESNGCSGGVDAEVENMRLDVDDPKLARAKGLKKKDNTHKGGGRLKPWHEKFKKNKKIVSQPIHVSKNITQSASEAMDVQNLLSSQTHNVETSYWPQTMLYGYNSLTHGVNYGCPPIHLQSSVSSQASYTPLFSQGITSAPTQQTTMAAELLFQNDRSFNFFSSDSQPPTQN